MTYKITEGIDETELEAWLKKAHVEYGRYKDKYVNYSQAKLAPIVMCTVQVNNEILIVKRGHGLADAEGYWSTVNGFIDEIRPVKEIAQQELEEELGLHVDNVSIKVGKSYTVDNSQEKRKYIVFPCLISLPKIPKIKLNEENTEYKWIKRTKLESFDILDDLPHAIDSALALI